MAGFEEDNSNVDVAKYWKNGQEISLSDGTDDAYAVTVEISGQDIIAGGERDNGGYREIAYWINGTVNIIPKEAGITRAYMDGMAFAGADIYICGTEENSTYQFHAKFWKNGSATPLSDDMYYSEATGIDVWGSDVYVAGVIKSGVYTNRIAVYWKNGKAVELSDGTADTYVSALVLGE